MASDPRDRIILEHAPLVAMPTCGELPELEDHHHRYIAAADGLYLEVRRPWLRAALLIAQLDLPYGPIADTIGYEFSEDELQTVVDRFTQDALQAMPNEFAGWGVWDAEKRKLVYRGLEDDWASTGGVSFKRPRLAPHESLAVDLHSHGALPAFFSTQDDIDDRGEVKISIVVGNVDEEPSSFKSRLCALGHFLAGEE